MVRLGVPKERDRSYCPSPLDPRKWAAWALLAVVQGACVQKVSRRRVPDLVQPLGMNGVSRSQVSRPCHELDGEVGVVLPHN